jgi:preprotein translocase subunit YajC
MSKLWLILAQVTQPAAPAQPQGGDPFMSLFFPLLLALGVFYFIMIRGQRKDRKRFDDLLKNLKRNDRVQTIGGVYGTVVDVRENEVVLKVDETNNVKMRFNRSAIKEVLAGEAPPPPK